MNFEMHGESWRDRQRAGASSAQEASTQSPQGREAIISVGVSSDGSWTNRREGADGEIWAKSFDVTILCCQLSQAWLFVVARF